MLGHQHLTADLVGGTKDHPLGMPQDEFPPRHRVGLRFAGRTIK